MKSPLASGISLWWPRQKKMY